MNKIIENPTADQLEAGGVIREGTYLGVFSIKDLPLKASLFDHGRLVVKVEHPCHADHSIVVRDIDGSFDGGFTITAYTPPESKPWWETCDEGTQIEARYAGQRVIRPAHWWRRIGIDITPREPRRVAVINLDTIVPVPREALDRLRRARRTYTPVGHLASATVRFLRDVDAES